jgi:hypothetical protein
MNDIQTSLPPGTLAGSGDKEHADVLDHKPIFVADPLVKNANAAYLGAKTLSLVWKVIQSTRFLENVERNLSVVWDKSRLLNHPYVQLKRGFVFIHVPKTAGTSLNEALDLHASLTASLHGRARDIMPFIHVIAPKAVAIAFVRHPYQRFISLYNFARMEESLYHSTRNPETAPYGKHPDHDLLIDKTLEQCAELLLQGKLGDPRSLPHNWVPQVEWLLDREGNLMVDFIGHVETIDADLQRLKQLHGITSKPLPWLNGSTGPEETPGLTPRTRELLRLYYKRDFELLGYEE